MAQYCIHGEENCNRCALNNVEAPTIHLTLILDGSPSMINRWPQTISGLNEYFATLRADQADNSQAYKVTMIQFSNTSETLYDNVELDSIPTFTARNLRPNGHGTALWNAVGDAVTKIETTEPVLVVVLTDGEENASHRWNELTVPVLMDTREKLGNYTYAYLGVTKEAWGNASNMGAGMHRNANNTVATSYGASTYTGLAGATVKYASSMRSMRASGQAACSVQSFWDGNTSADTAADEASITSTTGAAGVIPSK